MYRPIITVLGQSVLNRLNIFICISASDVGCGEEEDESEESSVGLSRLSLTVCMISILCQ